MQTYDVVIIGAGHNALVCASYLLKAGYSVLLLEKNSIPGGGATTEEALPQEAPGFKFNPCAIDHIFIHLGPIVQELELSKYGLEYLFCDPMLFCPHPDGKYFLGHRSVEKTCAEIERYSPHASVRDPSLAPEGKHTLWIEFFAPYKIKGAEGTGLSGTGWTDEMKNKVADRVLDKLADYTPNLKNSIIARRVESPAELEERVGFLQGNYYHLDMTFDQMVFFRPLPELANYTTPIEGLFLTGAGTHPGGAISGMPGRNCARVFLQQQHPVAQTLADAGNSLKSTAKSVFNIK